MTEEKEKRKATFGISIIQNVVTLDWYYEVFNKTGILIISKEFSSEAECRIHLSDLRKVMKNRYTATKIKSE